MMKKIDEDIHEKTPEPGDLGKGYEWVSVTDPHELGDRPLNKESEGYKLLQRVINGEEGELIWSKDLTEEQRRKMFGL